MIMSLIGQDPRWMEVFKTLTGVDLGKMNESKMEEMEQNKKREAEQR